MTVQVGGIITASDVLLVVKPPLVRLVQQSAQSLANSTDTAITFGAGSEEIDNYGTFHDETTNNTRITPKIAGYYRLTGAVFLTISSAVTSLIATIAKNGSVVPPRSRHKPAATALAGSAQVSVIQAANGTTDYFELFGQQTSGGALSTNVGGSFASVLECEYLGTL